MRNHVRSSFVMSVGQLIPSIEVAMLGMLVAVSLWNAAAVSAASERTVVIPGRAPIVQALFNPDGRRLYFATQAGVEGHDIEAGKRLFAAPYGRALVCSPKGDLLAVVQIQIGMVSIAQAQATAWPGWRPGVAEVVRLQGKVENTRSLATSATAALPALS